MSGFQPRSAMCKATTLPAVLALRLKSAFFIGSCIHCVNRKAKDTSFSLLFCSLGHTWRCIGVTLGSALRNCPTWSSGDHMGCRESNPGWLRARQGCVLYYPSSPAKYSSLWVDRTAGRVFLSHEADRV